VLDQLVGVLEVGIQDVPFGLVRSGRQRRHR
jgi:hypothetical protein